MNSAQFLDFWRAVFARSLFDAWHLVEWAMLIFGLVLWLGLFFVMGKPGGTREFVAQAITTTLVTLAVCLLVFLGVLVFYSPAKQFYELDKRAGELNAENATLKEALITKPVVHFDIGVPQKLLTVDNSGPSAIEDIEVSITKYRLLPDLSGIDEFSKWSGSPGSKSSLGPRDKWEFDLEKWFIRAKNESPDILNQYAVRITFRATATKQKYVHYMITSEVGPPFLQPEVVGGGGKYARFQQILAIRKEIFQHQAFIYDDDPSTMYRN